MNDDYPVWEPSGPPFEGWDCPGCGSPEPDGERLYCDDCRERMTNITYREPEAPEGDHGE